MVRSRRSDWSDAQKVGAPEEDTEAPCTARLTTEDETPRCLPAVTATAFLAISATVSFANFAALILELARAPKPSAIPVRLRFLDEIFWCCESLRAERRC